MEGPFRWVSCDAYGKLRSTSTDLIGTNGRPQTGPAVDSQGVLSLLCFFLHHPPQPPLGYHIRHFGYYVWTLVKFPRNHGHPDHRHSFAFGRRDDRLPAPSAYRQRVRAGPARRGVADPPTHSISARICDRAGAIGRGGTIEDGARKGLDRVDTFARPKLGRG